MPIVPLPKGYTSLDELPEMRESLVNLYNHDGSLVRTPGITNIVFQAGTGSRGMFEWNGDPFIVRGTSLTRVREDDSQANIGTITGTADVDFASSFTQMVVLVKGGPAYTVSPSFVTTQITDPNFVACDSVDVIAGRAVYIPSDGSPALYSSSTDLGVIEGFFDAESLPDQNRFTINNSDELWIHGTKSVQVFRTTTNPDLPFAPRGGSRIDTGYVSAGTRYNETYAFIGRKRDQSYKIFIMQQGQAVPISNDAVTQDLNEDFTAEEIESAYGQLYEWNGKEFLAFTIGDRTYTFNDGNWFFQDSNLNGTNQGAWRVKGLVFARGKYYCGDTQSNRVGELSNTASEYINDIEADFQTFIKTGPNEYFTPSRMEIQALTGQNGGTLGLSLSKDMRAFKDFHYRNLGRTGDHRKQIVWEPPGGLGHYDSCMGIRMRTTAQIKYSAESLRVD